MASTTSEWELEREATFGSAFKYAKFFMRQEGAAKVRVCIRRIPEDHVIDSQEFEDEKSAQAWAYKECRK